MRYLNRLLWAAVVVGLSASSGFAQTGSITTGGGLNTGSLSGTGGLAGGTGGGNTGGSGGSNSLGGTQLQTMQQAPVLGPPTGQNNSSLDSSNFLSGYYANPYYQGLITAQTSQAPGGFGSPLSGTGGLGGTGGARGTGASATRTSNTLATTSRTGTTTGTRTGGLGGAGGLGGTTNTYGQMVPLPVQITYAAIPDFGATPVAAPALQGDLSGMITRSLGAISNPAGVNVSIGAGNTVTLRGSVASDREARLVEGMVRLTPGVGYIKNELTFPVTQR